VCARFIPCDQFRLLVWFIVEEQTEKENLVIRPWLRNANPKDAEAWYYLGRAKYNENRFDEAITAFQQYLKLDPKSVRGEDNLGLSYQGLGRTDEARAAYKTAILWQKDLLNQDPGPFINLGALLLDENLPEQAV